MNKEFEKILERLEEATYRIDDSATLSTRDVVNEEDAKEIVQEVAEEYKDKPNIIDGLKIFLQEKFNYCAEQAEMNLEAECNSEIASYFRDRKELYLDRANIYSKVMREIDRIAQEYNNGWIPCSERLPDREEIKKAYCRNMYGSEFIVMIEGADLPTTLYRTPDGFWVDERRVTYKVIAWQPLPQPYKEKE